MEWVVNVTPRPLYSREREPVPSAGPVWAGAENLALTGIGSPGVIIFKILFIGIFPAKVGTETNTLYTLG
jgi:hypothetical protein